MKVFFNLRENFICTLHNFTRMLLSVTVQTIETTVQEAETKGNRVSLSAYSY